MSAPNTEEQVLPGVVNVEDYKKNHPQQIAQHTADALNQPVSPQDVTSPKHDLNDHIASQFEVVSPADIKKAEIKYPEVPDSLKSATIHATDIPGVSTLNRLITNMGFTKSNSLLEAKEKMLKGKAKELYGENADVQLVDKKAA